MVSKQCLFPMRGVTYLWYLIIKSITFKQDCNKDILVNYLQYEVVSFDVVIT